METLKIALIQTSLHWENAEANRIMFSKKIEAITEDVDVIILPEMYTTGFTMNAESNFEYPTGETVIWQQTMSKARQVLIIGSIIIKENNKFYNRLIASFPDGSLQYYNKRHTFTLAGEHEVFESGNEQKIIEFKGWKFNLLICYDLRFPVWARNTHDYDVLVYVANWPHKRIAAWDALLKARAIENMSYCIGVNRVGLDGNNYDYSGHSSVYNALGDRVDTIPESEVITGIVVLNKAHLINSRDTLQFLNDRDEFTLK